MGRRGDTQADAAGRRGVAQALLGGVQALGGAQLKARPKWGW